jgi:hypothetical protein
VELFDRCRLFLDRIAYRVPADVLAEARSLVVRRGRVGGVQGRSGKIRS